MAVSLILKAVDAHFFCSFFLTGEDVDTAMVRTALRWGLPRGVVGCLRVFEVGNWLSGIG